MLTFQVLWGMTSHTQVKAGVSILIYEAFCVFSVKQTGIYSNNTRNGKYANSKENSRQITRSYRRTKSRLAVSDC